MLDVDEDEKLTGEEEFELLAGPLGLSERRIVPEAVQFPDSDPLGASVAMVTATNSMEETLLQIGEDAGFGGFTFTPYAYQTAVNGSVANKLVFNCPSGCFYT